MPAITCPHCKVVVNFGMSATAGGPPNSNEILGIAFCMLCNGGVYFKLTPQNQVISHYPMVVTSAPDGLPPNVVKAFNEALICYSAEAPNGALLMCRRALQETMADKE